MVAGQGVGLVIGFRLPGREVSPPSGFIFEAAIRVSKNGAHMSAGDKAKNKIDDLGGKAKEATGKVTGDKSTENEGKVDQAKSSLMDAGEKIKDAFKS
jgi:uncharacterized protein YjbJ (UPF0337 family)